jgi:two-component system sensor histidine kinase/response regulator
MPFDVIIMDMQMPVMSGLEATHAIRNGLGPNAKTPIIALTANAFDDDRTAWLNAGAADFLTKPIDPIRLVDSILQTTARLDSEGRLGPRPAAWPEDEPLRVADRSALGGAA